jgi:hypothetical protein
MVFCSVVASEFDEGIQITGHLKNRKSLGAASLQSFNMNVLGVEGFHRAALFGARPAKHTVLRNAQDSLKTPPTL